MGTEEDTGSIEYTLIKFALGMSSNFNCSPDFWLDMSLIEMAKWALVAGRMLEEDKAKRNVQRIGPGL